jgi:AcrR family transcriptional regulator
MNKTKKKIIQSAIQLFNEQGVQNVRNQDIAENAGMSLSNYNYHFKSKKDLVVSVCNYMSEVLEDEVYGKQVLVKEGQGLAITKSYFQFQEKFKFFYLDTYNILQNYPEIREELSKQIEESLQIIKNLNYMSIGMGFMKPEPEEMPGLYDHLAEQVWQNNHFLFSKMHIFNDDGEIVRRGIQSLFAINYPYLTKEGIERYQQFIDDLY